METLRIRDHVPNVPSSHKYDIQLLLAVLSIAVDDLQVTNVTGEQGYMPLLLPLPLPFLFSLPKER